MDVVSVYESRSMFNVSDGDFNGPQPVMPLADQFRQSFKSRVIVTKRDEENKEVIKESKHYFKDSKGKAIVVREVDTDESNEFCIMNSDEIDATKTVISVESCKNCNTSKRLEDKASQTAESDIEWVNTFYCTFNQST